jgi:epoxyqueuosine reductase QueG
MSLGAIMTDAPMEPDSRLTGFDPCAGCDLCIRACPAGAYDAGRDYPESWSMDRCLEKRAEIEACGLYCNNCFAACPACRFPEEDLLEIRSSESFMARQRFVLTLHVKEI